MKIIIFLLVFCFSSINIYSQSSDKYKLEESKIINNFFLDIVGTRIYSSYYINLRVSDSVLIEYSKKPSNYEQELQSLDMHYKSFSFSSKLKKAKGDSLKFLQFKNSFNHYADSINRQIDSLGLVLFVTDTLYSVKQMKHTSLFRRAGLTRSLLQRFRAITIGCSPMEFKPQETGRYLVSNKKYPDFEERRQTAEIEVGLVMFSRVIFNSNMTKGYFYYTYFKHGKHGLGMIIVVEKNDGKWIINRKLHLWIS